MKRILLISHNALSFHNNNGKTLASIFEGWNPNSLAHLYFNNETPESSCFKNFFKVTDIDVLKAFACMGTRSVGTVVVATGGSSKLDVQAKDSGQFFSYVRSNESIKLLLRDVIFSSGLWFSPCLRQWLSLFNPESIFFLGGNSVFSFLVSRKIANFFKVPFDVYITDDYILNANPHGLLENFNYKRLCRVYRDAFANARHVFVIGDEMAEAFKKEYEREFIPVMNSIRMPETLSKYNFLPKQLDQIDVVYAGGLHLGRDESLVEFGRLIKSVSSQLGINIRLSVYSLQQPNNNILHKFNESGVCFVGAMGHEDLAFRLEKADILLHVESFEATYVAKTKLSISTKIPEYLASGTCLIAYGPSSLASIRIIKNNDIGLSLTEMDDKEILRSKLISVVTQDEVRYGLAKRGFEFAKKNFDKDIIKDRVQKILDQ